MRPVPGRPQRLNSLPMSMAVSPDARYVVTVNAGYGTFESKYMQSLAVLDTQTGKVADFPEADTLGRAKQTLYSGLAFSRDGKHLYASMGSETDPLGTMSGDTGSGVVVYGFSDGKIVRQRMMKIPLQQLAAGRKTMLIGGMEGDKGVPFPAAIAVLGTTGAEKLLVADNLSDDVLLMDAATGEIEKRFDLSENDAVPSTYPVALARFEGWGAGVCGAVECERGGRAGFEEGHGGAQAGAVEAGECDCAGDASVCAGDVAGWQDDVCGAGESGCGGGGECWGGAVFGEGILRYAAAAAELLWRGA